MILFLSDEPGVKNLHKLKPGPSIVKPFHHARRLPIVPSAVAYLHTMLVLLTGE